MTDALAPQPVAVARVAYRTWPVRDGTLFPECMSGLTPRDPRSPLYTWREPVAHSDLSPTPFNEPHGLHAYLTLHDARVAAWRTGATHMPTFDTLTAGGTCDELRAEDRHARRSRVTGAVVAWGRVVVHERGLRAQHARVLAFLDESQLALPGLAGRYGVPVLGTAELAAYAAWWGEQIDTEREG